MNFRKWICLIMALITILLAFAGCGAEKNGDIGSGGETKLSDLSGKKIGVVTSSIQAIKLPGLIPDATYLEFNTYADLIVAFNAKKVDAFSTDESIYKAMLWEGQSVDRIDEAIDLSDYGMIFEKGADLDLQNKVNSYIAKIKDNGVHKALEDKWFGDSEPTVFETYDDLDGANGTLKIGVSSASKPFVYIKDGKYAGFEVELMIGFCREYGYRLEFEDTAFAAIMAGVSSGKYQIGMSGITITEERRESVDFSAVNHTEDLVLVIHKQSDVKTFEDYKNANVGITTGTYAATIIHDVFPDATVKEFASIPDMMLALTQGKIDIILNDVSYYTCMKWEGMNVDRLEEPYTTTDFGIAFKKGENAQLREQMNAFIAKIKENGEYDRLQEKWFGDTEPTECADPSTLTGENGTLKVGTNNEAKPFGYIKNGRIVGYDVDFLVAFAKEYGYKLDIEAVSFPSLLAGLQTGIYDLSISGLSITEERMETIDFSDPYHKEDMIFLIKGDNSSSLDQFNGATLGVVTGSLYGGYSREQFPNATIKEFNTFADVLVALKGGKVDGIMLLFVYAVPFFLLLGQIFSLFLFFCGEMNLISGWWVMLSVAIYCSFGNFAPFFEIGTALFMDGIKGEALLLPLLLFNALFRQRRISDKPIMIHTIATNLGFLDAVADVLTGRQVKWAKTSRFTQKKS